MAGELLEGAVATRADASGGTCAVQPGTPLAGGTSYNWFVNATNASGTSPWSAGVAIRTP